MEERCWFDHVAFADFLSRCDAEVLKRGLSGPKEVELLVTRFGELMWVQECLKQQQDRDNAASSAVLRARSLQDTLQRSADLKSKLKHDLDLAAPAKIKFDAVSDTMKDKKDEEEKTQEDGVTAALSHAVQHVALGRVDKLDRYVTECNKLLAQAKSQMAQDFQVSEEDIRTLFVCDMRTRFAMRNESAKPIGELLQSGSFRNCDACLLFHADHPLEGKNLSDNRTEVMQFLLGKPDASRFWTNKFGVQRVGDRRIAEKALQFGRLVRRAVSGGKKAAPAEESLCWDGAAAVQDCCITGARWPAMVWDTHCEPEGGPEASASDRQGNYIKPGYAGRDKCALRGEHWWQVAISDFVKAAHQYHPGPVLVFDMLAGAGDCMHATMSLMIGPALPRTFSPRDTRLSYAGMEPLPRFANIVQQRRTLALEDDVRNHRLVIQGSAIRTAGSNWSSVEAALRQPIVDTLNAASRVLQWDNSFMAQVPGKVDEFAQQNGIAVDEEISQLFTKVVELYTAPTTGPAIAAPVAAPVTPVAAPVAAGGSKRGPASGAPRAPTVGAKRTRQESAPMEPQTCDASPAPKAASQEASMELEEDAVEEEDAEEEEAEEEAEDETGKTASSKKGPDSHFASFPFDDQDIMPGSACMAAGCDQEGRAEALYIKGRVGPQDAEGRKGKREPPRDLRRFDAVAIWEAGTLPRCPKTLSTSPYMRPTGW